MSDIAYIKFGEVNPHDFLPLLNKLKVREHLIQHDLLDMQTASAWVKSKADVDAKLGCKVRAIQVDNQLVGWCGIQVEDDKYEIAIVIDDSLWGIGTKIFNDVMDWAKVLGHKEIVINFLHTRPKYKFLEKRSKKVYESEPYGCKFTTYQLAIK